MREQIQQIKAQLEHGMRQYRGQPSAVAHLCHEMQVAIGGLDELLHAHDTALLRADIAVGRTECQRVADELLAVSVAAGAGVDLTATEPDPGRGDDAEHPRSGHLTRLEFRCPKCGGSQFGAVNGQFACHNFEAMSVCGWSGTRDECMVERQSDG